MPSSVTGIPTTRVSDIFIRERMLGQVQFDQSQLFRVMTQLSTGRRFEAPSEDPVASMRIISLQRLLERKTQVMSNLQTNQSYLSATEAAVANVSGLLAEMRGLALGVLGTTATDIQRETAVQQIDQLLGQLVDTGNQQFRGRYLFAGSLTTERPFSKVGAGIVEYYGNESHLQSYADVDLLFQTNFTGAEFFGAISEPVQGTADLNPVLTLNTRLSDLRGGLGISRGSIAVSDGTKTSIVDLSSAETIGDVAALIRANPPEGRHVFVDVTPTGLVVSLDTVGGGALAIREVGGGTVASELGIYRNVGQPIPIEGRDLNPILRATTNLDDCFGARAMAFLHSIGSDNDIVLEAKLRGDDLNGVTVRFVDDAAPGAEYVDYTPGVEVVVHISASHTESRRIVEVLNDHLPPLPFTARLDPLDNTGGGRQVVQVSATAEFKHGAGSEFDKASGLQITNRGGSHTIEFDSAQTVEDLLNAINGAGAALQAEINATATGINVRSRASGCDFAIGENGGSTAEQLGIRTYREETRLADLNYGRGVDVWPGYSGPGSGTDFTITAADGTEIAIDLTGLETIKDVIDHINNHADNLGAVEARLARFGNGIELVDLTGVVGPLTIERNPLSLAAFDLGLIPRGQNSISSDTGILTGTDRNPLETESVFTALLRIREGLLANNVDDVHRAIEMLDRTTTNLNFVRSELGTRQQGLDVLQNRLDSEDIELRQALSMEYDIPIEQVVSELVARQASYEASLRAMGRIFQMSLLDYL